MLVIVWYMCYISLQSLLSNFWGYFQHFLSKNSCEGIFPGIRHANRFILLERGCTWFLRGFIKRSLLELTNSGTSIDSFNSKLYHGSESHLSDITFWSTFPRVANGRKPYKFFQGMVDAFTCKASGFG